MHVDKVFNKRPFPNKITVVSNHKFFVRVYHAKLVSEPLNDTQTLKVTFNTEGEHSLHGIRGELRRKSAVCCKPHFDTFTVQLSREDKHVLRRNFDFISQDVKDIISPERACSYIH